jgi:subtilisin-like proprotein convertase family protein
MLTRRSLSVAVALFLMSIAGVTWAPTAAYGAGDQNSFGNIATPVVWPATKTSETAPAFDPPNARAIEPASSADTNVVGQRFSRSEANNGVHPVHYSQAGNASLLTAERPISVAEASTASTVVSGAGYRSPGQRHKVSVGDRQLVEIVKSQGGRVVADYGSFVLMETSGAVADSLAKNEDAQIVDENNLVLLNTGAIDTVTAAAQSLRAVRTAAGGKQMHLIQFAGPIRPEWYLALVATGARIVTYIPSNAYLVYGGSQTLQGVRQLASDSSVAQWDGEYTAAHRVDPAITNAKDSVSPGKNGAAPQLLHLSAKGNEQFTIQMVEDETENLNTLALIDQFKLEPIIKQDSMLGYFNVRVTLPRDVVVRLIAERGDVVSIQQWVTPKKRDERQNIIITGNVTENPAVPTPMDYLAYLAAKGFSTSTVTSFAVNLSDSGIDNGTTTPNHFGLYRIGNPAVPANSRVIYNRLIGTPNAGSSLQGCDGHGNENSHIIGGYVPTGTVGGVNFGAAPHADASGFRRGLGLAPFVKIGSSVIFDPNAFTSPIYQNLESQAYNTGARISSNSWGASNNAYTVDAQQYDALVRDAQPVGGCVAPNCIPAAGNQEYVIVFSAGNDGANPNTIGEPGTAKNVITVGASENVNPFGAADGCGIDDSGANNANDVISFSSRGPTSDGRRKPDIVAPGTHITSGVAQAAIASPPGSGTGAQIACFDGSGVCGGTAGSNFFPAGQQWYTSSSGTSHSTPAIAGVAALIRQHFINQALPTPSPALTKALMMNSARYLTGVAANDTLPSNNQGMGEINLNSYFDVFATAHAFHDQLPAENFTASGQQRVITGTVSDITKPLRVTLAWTDSPGPTSGNAFVNNLDLEVTVGGTTYKGNVFSGAFSAAGGVADTRNNVESVFIPAGVSGSLVIKVRAINIAGDGVPGNANPLDQDFALVAYNVTEAPLPVLGKGATAFTSESCSLANNAIDPGETVTLSFALSNIGTANTTNLVATLQTSGGVTAPSGPQNYGALIANGAAVSRPFTFTAATTCGQTLTATFQLQDGASNLGNVTFTFLTGVLGFPSTATYSTGNIAVPIPDVSTVDIPITITDTGVITDVNVTVRANHTFDGDIVFQLIAPDGTSVPLATNRGGNGANYGSGANDCWGTPTVFDDAAATAISAGTAPFAGAFKPESPLSALNGISVNGTWKLRTTDTAALDTGTIGCVQLQITRQRFVCCGVAGTPEVAAGGAAVITAESFSPANNAPDPGETLTATFPVINSGTGNTTNLVATLLSSGGITPVTTSQNYGVVVAAGATVSRPFTFVANGTCGAAVTATFHMQDGALDLGNVTYTFMLGTISNSTQTFSNAAPITIPESGTGATTGAPATPYPSNVIVSGAPTTISKLTATINNFNHTFPDDVDLLLVSPTGRKMIIMSDAGGSTVAVNFNITLDDAAAAALPDGVGLTSGTFRPSNYGTVQDPFPAPAPAGPYLTPAPGGSDTLTSAYTGAAGGNPNGTWSLYAVDDSAGDAGNILAGWTIALTTSTNVCSGQPSLALVSAQSRRVHGAAGTFALPLSLVPTNPTTEPRQGPAQTVVLTFNKAITGATAAITEGTATAAAPTFSGNDVVVNLTGVNNQQYVTISLTNISDGAGGTGGSASVRIGFLVSDVNQNRVITVADVGLVNLQLAQPVTSANFLKDVNASGTLTVADKAIATTNLTKALPAP